MNINLHVTNIKTAIIIPCYKVDETLSSVVASIPDSITTIYLVDDACPQSSVQNYMQQQPDNRVKAIYHESNKGVGGAMVSGFKQAIDDDIDIVVKVDGDGQMDVSYLPSLLQPILDDEADYTKGNRFHYLSYLEGMPWIRVFGNSCLSLINKFASGYWNIMDPTNGFFACKVSILKQISLDKIDVGYFFESDMLFRLSTVRAVVKDVPMRAKYADEQSSLSVLKVLLEFPFKYLNRFAKRIFYLYFLRDFNAFTLEFTVGLALFIFGMCFGWHKWHVYADIYGQATPTGTVMLAVMPVLIGINLLISAFNLDVANVPKKQN